MSIDPASLTNLHVTEHPLIDHALTLIRDQQTEPARFRNLISRVGELLIYESMRDLPTVEVEVETPLEKTMCRRLSHPVTIVPILRAGLGLADGILRMIPNAQMGHIGMARNEETLEPQPYYENLPGNITRGPVYLLDPMLATGGSAIASIQRIKDAGCTEIRMLCVLAAPEGVKACFDAHPDVPIYTASLERELNEKGYILPGLGDAGDRIFATT